MDEVTWTAVAGVLTVVGALWTWHAFRRRGTVSGLRGVGFTLLPVAAWATGSLEMLAEVSTSVVDWATGFVFSPLAWAGIVAAGLAVLLFGTAGVLSAKGIGTARRRGRAREGATGRTPRATGRAETAGDLPPASATGADDDLADIEALLKRRGIS